MTNSLTHNKIVKITRQWLATPYVHQASCKGHGCDCLGLIRGIWREAIGAEPVVTPGYTSDWGEVGGREILRTAVEKYFVKVGSNNALPGDLLLFRWSETSLIKHLGILTTPDRFVHAYEKAGVVESPLVRDWAKRIAGIYRFPGVKI